MPNITCKHRIFNNIDAIIFDKDGTLADSENFLRELAFKRARLIDAQITQATMKTVNTTVNYLII